MIIPFNTLTLGELTRRAEDSSDPLAKELARRINRLIETIPVQVRNLKENLDLEEMWEKLGDAIEKELTKQLVDVIPDIVEGIISGNNFTGAKKDSEETIKRTVSMQYELAISNIMDE